MHDDGHVIGNRLVGSQGVFSVIESLYMVKHQEHWNISYIIALLQDNILVIGNSLIIILVSVPSYLLVTYMLISEK